MTQCWTALSVIGFGAAGAIGGLFYSVLMVGVPDQDPMPAQAAAERVNLAVSGWIVGAGLIVLAAGLLMLIYKWGTQP